MHKNNKNSYCFCMCPNKICVARLVYTNPKKTSQSYLKKQDILSLAKNTKPHYLVFSIIKNPRYSVFHICYSTH